MLLLCALIVGSGSAWAVDIWVKTAPTDFKTGDIVVIVDQTTSKAMTNNNGTSSAPSATEVTLNSDKSEITSEVASTLQWEVTVSEDTYKFGVVNTSNYLYCTDTNNGVRVGTNTNNVFTWVSDPNNTNSTEYFLINSKTSRYIGVYSNQDWRCYTSINSNIKETVTAFYKKTASSDPSVATTITIDDSGITNTNMFVGTAAGSFSATVLAGDQTVEGATVTWSSATPSVATINETTGEVTLVAAGSTVITASYAGVANQYRSSSKDYSLNVINVDPNSPGTEINPYTVAQARAAIDAEDGVIGVYAKGIVSEIVTAYNSQYGNISYNISADGLTSSDQLQAYRGKGIGGAKFTSAYDIQIGDEVVVFGNLKKYNDTYEFDTDNQLVSLKRQEKTVPQLLLEDDFSMEVTATKLVTDLYITDSNGEVTVTSSKPSVAKIENGELVALSKGSTTLTISIAATDTYKPTSGTINVTVNVKNAVQPEGAGAGGFSLVTDASTLKAGDKLLIVNQDVDNAIGTDDSKNNRPAVGVTVKDGKIAEIAQDVQIITLEGETDAWYFNVGDDAYLYASSNSSNQLKTSKKETVGDNGKAKISIEDNVATIIFQGSNARNDIRYNPNNGSPIFSCYASSNATFTKPLIYRQDAATSFDITIGDAGWRTLVTAQDVILPQGLTAYVVTATEDDKVTLQEAGSIKANNPYILNGAKGTYTLSIALGVKAPAENLLQISTESTGNGVYVLAKPDGNEVGFYKWAGNSLGAGRVYLPAPSAGAPEFLGFVFDGETTGVKAIENGRLAIDNAVYNLAGQRVANPTKGLYIVNGKKVIIK